MKTLRGKLVIGSCAAVLAKAREMGPPLAPRHVEELRQKLGDVPDAWEPFREAIHQWERAMAGRDAVALYAATRRMVDLMVVLAASITAVQEEESHAGR